MRHLFAITLIAACLAAVLCAAPLYAAPRVYALQPDGSNVSFSTDFGPDKITGTFPVQKADLTLDFDNLAKSRIAVTLDVAHANASFPFAAQALKGPKVLDAKAFPLITFKSTAVRRKGENAEVDGTLTIRGKAKSVTLLATLYRQKGQAEGDLSLLTIRLTGTVNRSEFGATGWSDLVSDEVRLDILARIAEQN